MSISLYDVSVRTYLQIVPATAKVLKKAAEFADKNGIDPDSLLKEKIYGDMLPLHFQLSSVRQHSIGAVQTLLGSDPFTPPDLMEKTTFAEFQELLQKTREELEAVSEDEVNAAAGKIVGFKFGAMELKFTAEDFILTMSLPNFYFHATTTYDILRMKGVGLGKMDFQGRIRMVK